MATITEIRNRSGLVIGAIGIAIVLFLVSDAIQSNQYLFQDRSTTVGEIADEEISIQEYEQHFKEAQNNYKVRTGESNIDAQTMAQINDQAWEQLILEKMFNREYEDLGLKVTNEELFEFIQGENIHPSVKKAFTNPKTNQFDRNQLIGFLKNMDSDDPRMEQQKQQWIRFEQSLVKERVQTKYFELVKKGYFVTDLEAREDFMNKNKFANFSYIYLPAKDIPDSTVEYSESELTDYYSDHKEDYKQEASRTAQYVIFDIYPDGEDTAKAQEWIKAQIEPFKNARNDSLFIELNSDMDYDSSWHGPGELGKEINDNLFTANQGKIIGPYFDDGFYKIAKLLNVKEDSNYSYRASHILIKPKGEGNTDTATALDTAEALLDRIQSGESFEELAREYGEDGTSTNGGDLGWFREGSMVKKFQQAVAAGEKGDLKVVKTRFGAHVIKITEEPTNRKIKVGVIAREIIPSSETFQDIYSKAAEFRAQATDVKSFNELVQERGYNKRIADQIEPGARSIPGFSDPSRFISWMYNNEEGSVSDPLEINQRYIIAALTNVQEEGIQPLEQVKDKVADKVIKENKLKMLASRMQEAGGTTLEEKASSLDISLEDATNINYNTSVIPGIGNEPKVIGTAFGLNEGESSGIIKGSSGAFMIKLNSFSSVEPPANLSQTKEQMLSTLQNKTQFEVMNVLKEIADPEDQRYKFY